MKPLRMAWRLVVSLVIAGLVALNIATLTLSSVFGALSGLVEMLDVPTVQASHKAEADRLDRERRQAAAARDRAQAEARDAKADRDRARAAARTARGERDAASQSARVQKAHAARMQADLAAATGRVRALGEELSAATARLTTFTTAVGTQVDSLSRSVARRTARRVTSSLATLPARVIPFAGIAATVGFTAWDVAEACASLREMAAMRSAVDLAPDPEGNAATVCGQKVPDAGDLEEMLGGGPAERVATCKDLAGPFDIEARDACEALRDVETRLTEDGGAVVVIGPDCIGPTCGGD